MLLIAWEALVGDALAVHLALHGVAVLIVSFVAGLFTHRAIRLRWPTVDAWHLAHAGGSSRGILLLALAGAWHLVQLSAGIAVMVALLWLFFVWSSVAAMVIAAATGHRGLAWSGSALDRTVFGLYVAGTIAVFPAGVLLAAGFLRAL